MKDALLFQSLVQGMFDLGCVLYILRNDMCGQGVFGGADGPDVQVMDALNTRIGCQ